MRTGLAAAALIICISMGYMACSRMRDRVDKLNALCAEIRTLGDSMELSQYRLSEMLDRLGGELWREYTAALTGEQLGARLTLRQMEARAADAEKALMGKGKLYSTLGVLAGFAAALMMI